MFYSICNLKNIFKNSNLFYMIRLFKCCTGYSLLVSDQENWPPIFSTVSQHIHLNKQSKNIKVAYVFMYVHTNSCIIIYLQLLFTYNWIFLFKIRLISFSHFTILLWVILMWSLCFWWQLPGSMAGAVFEVVGVKQQRWLRRPGRLLVSGLP